ncbi:xanthine dehydrogenase family protein molybdopterin-binding subunit [Siminovitchia acidinfaciens]|uniref:Xanthine dehydrogenase family protein molybdopterin-binding subunit n=1 Tax=Siminovitchia acidinfaciens TaxID=2321395 RepID=A0A429XTV0_9BACI|nr:molybdopterin cofactor-binding domain-containing protein [Siminovitchia acidinfaciens]RST71257.1 xanthine dehydrogenase family protein molybdopterin-binding subunit [Siminovitchia acidinfaciens]
MSQQMEDVQKFGTGEGLKWVGKAVKRIDGPEKVTGEQKYMTDYHYPDMVWGKVLRAKYPFAKIRSIDTSKAEAHPDVVCVLTHENIPGFNGFGIVTPDQPVLCEDIVRCTGDAVALVAAETLEAAEEAIGLIEVDYDPLEAVTDAEAAMVQGAPQLHPDGNIHSHVVIKNGDIDKGFEEADFIFENTFYSPRQMHAFLETEGGWGKVEEDGSLTIQCPGQYGHRDKLQIARALALNPERIHIHSSPNGGGFGGKDEITVQIYLALLALNTNRRPVKLHLSREESVVAGIKRHPFKVTVKTGAKKDGTLVAHKVRAVGDTGAYASLGGAVVALAIEHAAGPYKIPNVDMEGFCVYTNNGIAGAFRGFGVNQVCVGIETHIDMLAKKTGLDPIEIRKKNAYRQGEVSSLGHVVKSSVGTIQTLERAEECDLWVNRDLHKSQASEPWKKRGVALATSFHAIGMGLRTPDYGAASIELMPDGKFKVGLAIEEIGTGNGTVYAQVAAECLKCDIDNIIVLQGDTRETLDSGTISASRSTYTGGRAIATAAPNMIGLLSETAAELLGVSADQIEVSENKLIVANNTERFVSYKEIYEVLRDKNQSTRVEGHFYFPREKRELKNSGGAPHHLYGYMTHVVLVEVDTLTGETDVLKVVAIPDVGKVLNPQGLEGQTEGGAIMGIGYTLYEDVIMKDGYHQTRNLTDYIIPTIRETPVIETVPVESMEASGPFGAKGIAEVVMIPIIPAIMNAIHDAVGVRIKRLPAKPEQIYQAIQESKSQELVSG